VVATGDNLLAGAITPVGSQNNRGAPAGSRQRLGDVVVTYLRDNRAGSSGNQAPKIGCLNRPTIGGYASAQDLSAEGLEQTPMSLLVPLLEFNPEWSGHHKCRRDDIEQFQKVKRSFSQARIFRNDCSLFTFERVPPVARATVLCRIS
jgi:hypothetical protein